MTSKKSVCYTNPTDKMLIELLQNKIYEFEKYALERLTNKKKLLSQVQIIKGNVQAEFKNKFPMLK